VEEAEYEPLQDIGLDVAERGLRPGRDAVGERLEDLALEVRPRVPGVVCRASEVFSEANRFGAGYEVMLYSADGRDVASSTGMRISVHAAAAEAGPLEMALVAGGDVFPAHPVSPELAEAARILAGRARRTASICTGTFILAAAGLLDGRRATTHWQHARTLVRAHPAIKVEPDAIYVEDGQIFSSAGVSAGIDLALALVERDYGAGLARDVARSLVVFLQRPGGQSQFSPSLRAALPRTSPLRQLCDTVAASPAGDYSLAKLAAMASVSPRHLTRLFRDELKTTPARYVELIQHPGVSPRACRQRFRSAIRN
jgi:transcriptional regulator GlxA family with amidase domain